MIGIALGLLPVSLLPSLPGRDVIAGLIVVSLLMLGLPHKPCRLACGIILGFALALLHGQSMLDRKLPSSCVREPLLVSGHVASLPRHSVMPGGVVRQRFEFAVASVLPAHCSGPATVLLSHYGPEQIRPGERWSLQVLLRRPWGLANPGSFNMQSWYAQTGIDAVGSVRRGGATPEPGGSDWRTLHHQLRWKVSRAIGEQALPPDVIATLRAVTVADKSGLNSTLWNLFQLYGLNHLLVISGLHIGLVAAVGHLVGTVLARLPGVGLYMPALLAVSSAAAYTALAGFSLATQRALVMLVCFALATRLGRSSGSANNLLLAALVVLLLNPMAPLGSGFWLSFGAVACLLWLARWSRGRSTIARLLGTHLFMSLAMLPMGAWWFGGSSLVSALSNLVMIPLLGMAVVPVALLATVFYLLSIPGEVFLWQLAGWPLEQLLPWAQKLAAGGESGLYRHMSPSAWELPPALVAILLLALPLTMRVRAMAVSLLIPLWLLPPPPGNDREAVTKVTVLDVGQGTAVVIQAGRRALLYDTGGGDPGGLNMANSVILPYLRRAGVAELDTLIVSHQDMDHSAGTAAISRGMTIKRFLYGGSQARVAGGQPCSSGQSWSWPGGQQFQLLAPAQGEGLAGNDGSCVLIVTLGDRRLLLPGDVEATRERELVRRLGPQLRADWLLVGHHGSLSSSSFAWLKTVAPDMAVVSSAYASRFGHPHPAILERLAMRGVRVLGTAAGGALQFEFSPGQAVSVKQYRQGQRRFWM